MHGDGRFESRKSSHTRYCLKKWQPINIYRSHKIGLNAKVNLATDARGKAIQIIVIDGTKSDCNVTFTLIAW